MDSRPRRVNPKRDSRLELLRKIREAKERGERLIIEKEEAPVYETVDESTYSKIVQERIEDDWIVDDNGLGYVDDGREIFDDRDGDVEGGHASKKQNRGSTASRKFLNPDLRPSTPSSSKCGSKDIRSMFTPPVPRPSKRLADAAEQDAALDDLLAELDTEASNNPPLKKPKSDSARKSLPQKRPPREPKLVPSRRETIHTVSPRPNPKSPYASKSYPDASSVSKPPPTKPLTKPVEVVKQPDPEPDLVAEGINDAVLNRFMDDAEDEDDHDEGVEEPPAGSTISTNWIIEEAENSQVSFADQDTPSVVFSGEFDGETLRFFWLDAYEDTKSHQGVVYLFGKIPCKDDHTGFCSCCIRVKDLERRVFFLPRPDSEYTVKDVYAELRELCGQWKIGKFKCKPITKKYCFEHMDVPSEAKYLEVRYSASYPSLPVDLTGKTFSRIFGSSASFTENLLLDLCLRGPCWLDISGATPLQPQLSWCKADYDFSWQKPNKMVKLADALAAKGDSTVQPPPAPPIRMVALDVKSVVRKQSSSAEIISVGLLIDNHFHLDKPAGKKVFQSHYLVLAPPKDAVLPYDLAKRLPTWGRQYQPPASTVNPDGSFSGSSSATPLSGVDVEPNERALLGRLLTRLHRLDPDLVVGHDLWGNQLDLLVHRLVFHKVAHWHRVGRLRRSQHFSVNFSRSWFMRHALPGRLVCDTRISSRELVRSRTYNLSELAFSILGGGSDRKARRQVPAAVARQFASASVAAAVSTTNATSKSSVVEVDEALIAGVDLEVDSADLRCLFLSAAGVKELIDFCLSDALLVLRLANQLQALPLAHQITSICGNVMNRTLAGGRSERNDTLLLHAFTERGYLPPEPIANATAGVRQRGCGAKEDLVDPLYPDAEVPHEGKRKPAYAGGLVLDPKVGFYDSYILLLDFNSLYPSIIQEFNLCFTTMERSFFAAKDPTDSVAVDTEDLYISELIASVTQSTGGGKSADHQAKRTHLPTAREPGILPSEVRRLVESRKEVKKLIAAASAADSAKVAQWNIRQQALKITANSVYGCLGFGASRFCARGLAALVTGLGRALLVNTKELVENMKLDVIYGDTDSIMVNTNSKDLLSALAIGEKVKHEVNRRYRLVELDTDGVFAAMLLLAKKKYAALAITRPLQYAEILLQHAAKQGHEVLPPPPTKVEMKGLDIVRRDWCRLAAGVGRFCVNTLLSGRATSEAVVQQIHDHLRTVARQVRDGTLPATDFVITKMLTKNPEDYPDAKSQPHVLVALRFNQQKSSNTGSGGGGGGHRFRAGDTVEYVVCDDGTSRSAVQRAYSPAELAAGYATVNMDKEGEEAQERQLKIDVSYYLAGQIHPVVSRLVAPIEGTSPAHVADCLGLDSAAYRRSMAATAAAAAATGDEEALQETSEGGSMFSGTFLNDADPLTLACPAVKAGKRCPGKALIRASPFTEAGLATWVCPECSEPLLRSARHAVAAMNQLVLQARSHITAYESGALVCEDPTCGFVTRTASCPPTSADGSVGLWVAVGGGGQATPLCPLCDATHSLLRPQHSEIQLYRQLLFYRHLLTSPLAQRDEVEGWRAAKTAAADNIPSTLLPVVRQTLESGLGHVRRFLAQSAFATVDLGQIFVGLRTLHRTEAIHASTSLAIGSQS